MPRILEPELMLTEKQCIEYDIVSKRQYSSNSFIEDYIQYCNCTDGKLLDFGTGPGNHLTALSARFPELHIIGFEQSDTMINLAKQTTGLEIRKQDFTTVEEDSDCIICLHTLHHLHDPMSFWKTIKKLNPKYLYVEDLVRLDDFHVSPYMIEDFVHSIRASFTVDEIKSQLECLGLPYKIEVKPYVNNFSKFIVYQNK